MKKFFTLLVSFATLFTVAMAQDEDLTTLQFLDASGNVIESGGNLVVNAAEEDAFGDVKMDSWIKVSNTTGSKVLCNIAYTISQIDNGQFEVCFPNNCEVKSSKGSYETTIGELGASETKSSQSAWLPETENYGKCVVKLQILIQKKNAVTGKYSIKAYGPTVNVEFVYDENSTSAITSLGAEKVHLQAYNILGQPVDDNFKGIVIVGGKKVIRK